MGKVYEALNRTEKERRRSQEVVAAFDAIHRTENENDETDLVRAITPRTTRELERFDLQPTLDSLSRKPLPPPVRNVRIEPGQIDRNLCAFQPTHIGAAEYCKLAINVIAAAESRLFRRLLVASAHRGEGRTCIALNLACALAEAKKRVLVVDADLHNPSMLRMLGVDIRAGLPEVLARGLPLAEALVRVMPYDFDALPTRSRVTNPAELLSSSEFRQLLQALDPDYDFVIFDSSPLLTTADSKLISRLTEATLLVIRPGKTSSNQMSRAIFPLKQEDVIGVVLNRARE